MRQGASMKIRDLKAIGFDATFDKKGRAVLSMPLVQMPADFAAAVGPVQVAEAIDKGCARAAVAAGKLRKLAPAPNAQD